MPAFAFTDEQLRAIVNYIRDLKPDLQAGGAK
jgi:mono/diheme cytochrome c family protein